MKGDSKFKPSKTLSPAPATAPVPWMPKKASAIKDIARSRAAKKGS